MALDTAQYQLDLNHMAREKGSEDMYGTFNLLVRCVCGEGGGGALSGAGFWLWLHATTKTGLMSLASTPLLWVLWRRASSLRGKVSLAMASHG